MGKKEKMNQKQKLIAYVLNTDADLNRNKNITQKEIGNILGFSQSTIAQNIKEIRYQSRINELKEELSRIKREVLLDEKYETLDLPLNVEPKYEHKPD